MKKIQLISLFLIGIALTSFGTVQGESQNGQRSGLNSGNVKEAETPTMSQILENIKAPVFPDRAYKVKFNKNKKSDWNKLINKKIDECSNAGGGTVALSPGTYFCNGPVVLKNNVNLHLEEGVRLLFSQNADDYLPVVLVRWEGTEAYNYSPFIYASYAENFAITGKGIIDGNGQSKDSFRNWRPQQRDDQTHLRAMGRDSVPVENRVFGKGHFLRPQLVHFMHCKNILLEGIKVVDGSFWLIQPSFCSNITVRDVSIESQFINNDGVDVDSSTDILIENCHFNTGDDFVAIKSGRDQDGWRADKPSKNIVIRNSSSDNCLHGVSFGSELSGGIENVYVENLTFKRVRDNCIQLKSNKDRGGYLRNIVISGIKVDSVKTCIMLTSNYHGYQGGNAPTLFENIQIENVECNAAEKKAINIEGLPEMPIKNVSINNVTVGHAGENSTFKYIESLDLNNARLSGSNSISDH